MNQIKLSSLPNEAKLTVVQYLSVKDYLNLSETSRYWFNFIEKNVKYLPKWEVDEFSVRCSGNSEEGLECEAICRGGKPTRIKKIQSKNGDELCTTFQRINVSHSLYFELKSPLNCTEILKENAKRVQQLALQISNTSNFTLGYFIDLISSLPRCEVLSLEMDGMDERNEGKLILQAIPILRHMEIRSLNSPFYFDDSALETLTERSSAENAIDCLVLSTAATSFSIE
uniref:F-box domain-containing protein n=1 Tax=Acrobeloides nanus TaxID=290746 RepID=A0A914D2M1_9BILA